MLNPVRLYCYHCALHCLWYLYSVARSVRIRAHSGLRLFFFSINFFHFSINCIAI